MADPRFYDNRGPFAVAKLFLDTGLDCPVSADPGALVFDIAGLAQAGEKHLSFFDTARSRADFLATRAGWCLVQARSIPADKPAGTMLLPCAAVGRIFAHIARLFYPEHELDICAQDEEIHPTARIGSGVVLGPGVVIGPFAEIGDGTRLGAHSVVGRGVTIGQGCQIGSHVSIAFAHLGDEVVIQPGVVIGGSGFGFFSGSGGHRKIPQLGRVIVQDRVEIGANTTIDRGALADTVVGEGSKIDNLVQIGHNTTMGRHCILAGHVGVSGSAIIGDFVIMGGKVGISDHVTIGDRARLAALSGVGYDLEGGRDYGGVPARPVREWMREMATLAVLAKKKQTTHE